MPVEGVHIVQCKHVDELLHLVHAKEVSADVEHHAAIGKARRIGDVDRRHLHLFAMAVGQRFAQRVDAAECSGSRGTVNHYAVGTNSQLVGFAVGVAERGVQHDAGILAAHLCLDARELLEVLCKHSRLVQQRGVAADAYALFQHKRFALRSLYLIG